MTRLPFIAVVLAAMAGVCARAEAAPADAKPVLAIVPFTGPGGKEAEVMIGRTLRKKATLVPQATWLMST